MAKARKSLDVVVGVFMVAAGIMLLAATFQLSAQGPILSLVMITLGAFQIVVWLTRDPLSTKRQSSWVAQGASRFGGGFAAIGVGLLVFYRVNVWHIAMGLAFLIMGVTVVYLSMTTDRQ